MGLSLRRGGDPTGPALLLIHGLGATGHVWDGLISGLDPRGEAVERALKVAGLAGLIAADSAAATSCVVPTDAGWRLAMDPAAFAVGKPDLPSLLAAARGEVILGAGEHDPMGPPAHLRELRPDPVVLPGLGHNAHVEDPSALLPLLDRLRAGQREPWS